MPSQPLAALSEPWGAGREEKCLIDGGTGPTVTCLPHPARWTHAASCGMGSRSSCSARPPLAPRPRSSGAWLSPGQEGAPLGRTGAGLAAGPRGTRASAGTCRVCPGVRVHAGREAGRPLPEVTEAGVGSAGASGRRREAASPRPALRMALAASTHLAVGAGDPSRAGAAVAGLSVGVRVLLAGRGTRGAHAPIPTGLRGARSRCGQGRGRHRAGQAATAGPSAQQQRQKGQRGQQLRTRRLGAAERHGRPGGRGSESRSWGAVAAVVATATMAVAAAAAVAAGAAQRDRTPPAAAGTVVPRATAGGASGAGLTEAGRQDPGVRTLPQQ